MTVNTKFPQLNRSIINTQKYPTKVLQFGDGNFLRAFIDWMFHSLNHTIDFNAGITVVKARPGEGKLNILNEQEGLYTLFLKGIKNGEVKNEHQIIDCINKGINPYSDYKNYIHEAVNPELQFLVSNTTEAGIVFDKNDVLTDTPQSSFPGKVTAFLYERFKVFNGDPNKGLIFIPCELIDDNGTKLKEIVLKYSQLWNLGKTFNNWVNSSNIFCNTLVDRIVSGHPKEKLEFMEKSLGYRDELIVEGEQYHLLVIEAPKEVQEKLPANTIGLNVVFTDDISVYKKRKVRILNGAHTTLVPVAYLYGIDTVRESVENKVIDAFLKEAIFNEICPTLALPESDLNQFSNDVLDRFRNPYLEHALMSISLNSISKFKTRVLPSILEYIKITNKLPTNLIFSLASLIVFYKGDRNGEEIVLKDDQKVLDFFNNLWDKTNNPVEVAQAVLSNLSFWDTDLTKITGLQETVSCDIDMILKNGMRNALRLV